MSKRIDERIPREVGAKALPNHPAVKTPWEKLISFHDAYHFACRHNAVVAANIMQAYRILIPDYEERTEALCTMTYERRKMGFSSPFGQIAIAQHNVHPFMRGNFTGTMSGDAGDECLLMSGRVTDFGTYRVEKELDVCYWDIVGSEFCRGTTRSLQGVCDGYAAHQPGPRLELHMVEAKGCGDKHCRIVAEDRNKFPMPEHKNWEVFGPIATSDQIKYTEDQYMKKNSQYLQEECDFKFCNGTCWERDASEGYYNGQADATEALGADYILPMISVLIQKGRLDEQFVDHVLKCVSEAAGKTAFGDFYAKKGLCDWLGVPNEVNDGRIMGAYIEVLCQMLKIDYEIEAFNKDEVIYRLNRAALARRMPKLVDVYLSMWYGMTRTLVGSEWFLWEEKEYTADDVLRIKIGKKIDKFC